VSATAKEIYMEPPRRGSSSSSTYSSQSTTSNSSTSKYYNYNASAVSGNSTYSPTTLAPAAANDTTTTTWVHPNFVHTPVYDRHKGMPAARLSPAGLTKFVAQVPEWGDSTSTDSTIIICTVGIMALLVGAISARRMRSRSVLSMCIENESLEDDVAYDAAYTIPAGSNHAGGMDNQYHTFNSHNGNSSNSNNQQGWKGDLEKFDV
jgi:hypothetical protein